MFCTALPAWSDTVRAGQLELDVVAPWQRLTADADGLDSNIVLHQAVQGATLDAYLAKRPVHLQTTPDSFYEQLDHGWRVHYGERVDLGWQEIAGIRWRFCRHPGRDDDSTLFQLVTVHDGEAYQVLVVAPSGSDDLPDEVRLLLQQIHWNDTPPVDGKN